MGILNRTPDSFSDGGAFFDEDKALSHIEEMVASGADIIDIGGESTRPGSDKISIKEEIDRVVPIIKKASKNIGVPISIDTYKSEVADAALTSGALIVNDISALGADPQMKDVVARHKASVILMHMRGTPKTMQQNPVYSNLINEIITYLEDAVGIAREAGISEDKIIIDPGIGFGKTTEHNLSIIRNLAEFTVLKKPILMGTSRKSFIGNILNTDVKNRLMGTAASVAISILNGANIVRVHDVGKMQDVVRLVDAVKKENRREP